MGDSHIFFQIILKENQSSLSTQQIKDSICLSADSTLCDVISHIQSTISLHNNSASNGFANCSFDESVSATQHHQLVLYDCTTYPPKDITSKVNYFTCTVGPKSITLQTLGWFPSAKLYICQADDEVTKTSIINSKIHLVEEFEYNNPELRKKLGLQKDERNENKIELTGELGAAVKSSSSQLLPSQLLKAVESRFEEAENNQGEDENHKQPTKRYRAEQERRTFLDMRLDQLEKNAKKTGKNKKMSEQVRKMLIKSRAEGDKKVRQEDRFYLEVVLLDESNKELCDNCDTNVEMFMKSTHMFFSRVSTIGKVVSAGAGSLASARDKGAELLVLTETATRDEKVYRRLPPTLPIYEAQKKGYIENFGRVIVRIFKGEIDAIAAGYSKPIDL